MSSILHSVPARQCPASCNLSNKEKIVGTTANCKKIVSTNKKSTSQKGKSKTADSIKQLSSVRVVQRNLVYIVGLPLSLADEDVAVYGRDPNWSCITCATGYAGIPFNTNELRKSLGDITLMEAGQPLPFDRVAASNYL